MVVCDKDGKNEKSVRLPLNEGLAQITVLAVSYTHLDVYKRQLLHTVPFTYPIT